MFSPIRTHSRTEATLKVPRKRSYLTGPQPLRLQHFRSPPYQNQQKENRCIDDHILTKSPDPDLLSSIVQVYTRTRNIYSQAKQLHRVFPRVFTAFVTSLKFIHISMSSHVSSVWEAMGSPIFFKTYGKLPTPPGWDVVGSGDPQHRVERFRGVRVLQRLAQNDGEFRLKVDLAMAQYEKMGGSMGILWFLWGCVSVEPQGPRFMMWIDVAKNHLPHQFGLFMVDSLQQRMYFLITHTARKDTRKDWSPFVNRPPSVACCCGT